MLVDEIFALYLYKSSLRVNETFYKTMLAFIAHFRQCLEENGWNKKEVETTDNKNTSFCLHNNAEVAPELINELVPKFIDKRQKKKIH